MPKMPEMRFRTAGVARQMGGVDRVDGHVRILLSAHLCYMPHAHTLKGEQDSPTT